MMPRERRRPIVELNMIPMIDVSLILMIIFMVLTPVLIQSQLTVKLPKAASGHPAKTQNTVTVQISRKGRLTIEGKAVKWGRLEKELSLILSRSSQRTVLVQADRTVAIERVVKVLDVSKKLGVGKLGIGVIPEK